MLAFKTKSETLKLLEPVVAKSRILPQVSFTVRQLIEEPLSVRAALEDSFGDMEVIVRSSALNEDGGEASQAGKYTSILNVSGIDAVVHAAENVAKHFDGYHPDNLIFVQPMLQDIVFSGVIFTADPNTCGNYYIINYDDTTGSTSSVTSGSGVGLQTYYLFKQAPCPEESLRPVIEAAKELEELFHHPSLDIEFAVTGSGQVYVFQVRPLVMEKPSHPLPEQIGMLGRISGKIHENMGAAPYLHGKNTIFGVMPDWNPAEMIGIRPRPLALSLYKRLITDGTWAYQRNNYGYKNLRGFPLMIDFEGLPYIDTRVSFNSFIPKDIDAPLSSKLADYYLDKLREQPDKHDKVEFDIIFSCYTFDLPERIQALLHNGFTENEITRLTDSLRSLTNHIINPVDGLWISDLERIRILEERRGIVSESELNTISKIYWLLQDCVRYGTLPFAGLARGGFIAVLLLRSLVSTGILNDSEYQNYMRSLNTVSTQMGADRRTLSLQAFIKKYGHLRPGTYDILSSRYDAAPELYFSNWTEEPLREEERPPFTLTLLQYEAIQKQMKEHGLQGDVLALFQFIKAGIEGREYAKFVFTKSLSEAIERIAQLGEEHGFSREELSYLDISVIDTLYASSTDVKKCIAQSIARGKEKYAAGLGITLPPVITRPQDVYSFFMPTDTPNFITMKAACAPVEAQLANADGIKGKILLIQAADPGYDWIFSHDIKGFITAFGGANSHMAIRAGELGIPAVIGVGEKMFAQYCRARCISIDCANKKIETMKGSV